MPQTKDFRQTVRGQTLQSEKILLFLGNYAILYVFQSIIVFILLKYVLASWEINPNPLALELQEDYPGT